jgi:hypothetical protein
LFDRFISLFFIFHVVNVRGGDIIVLVNLEEDGEYGLINFFWSLKFNGVVIILVGPFIFVIYGNMGVYYIDFYIYQIFSKYNNTNTKLLFNIFSWNLVFIFIHFPSNININLNITIKILIYINQIKHFLNCELTIKSINGIFK